MNAAAIQSAIWDAINEYAEACGGDTSDATISDRRMRAVAAVERALRRAAAAEPMAPDNVRTWQEEG